MSEAMSKREIEDVLSSIRRLVSHDVKPTQTAPDDADARTEKLVLTPALRVEPSPSDDAAAESEPPQDPSSSLQVPVSTGPNQTTETVVFTEVRNAADTTSLLGRIASAGEIGAHARSTIADRSQNLENGTVDQEPTPDPKFNAASTDLPAPDRFMMERGSALPEELNASDPSIEAATIEATLARLEEMLSNTTRGRSLAGGSEDGDPHDEDIIDEGMLYQLVAHIVRQELQGELGEKITRNIRKLVRAEVARELQLRQL